MPSDKPQGPLDHVAARGAGVLLLATAAVAVMLAVGSLADANGQAGSVQPQALSTAVHAAPGTTGADAADSAIDVPLIPTRWMAASGRDCKRKRGRFVCDGPRRVPEPHGEAAARAERLGLGQIATARTILRGPPEPAWVEAVQGRVSKQLRWPVDGGRPWRGFGLVRRRPLRRRPHLGMDIGAPTGSHIRSVADGLVLYSNNGVSGYGNLLMVAHADAAVTMYAHCRALYVFAGQRVQRGQIVGEVGTTGLARGSHLHFELRERGRARNPVRRLESPAGLDLRAWWRHHRPRHRRR